MKHTITPQELRYYYDELAHLLTAEMSFEEGVDLSILLANQIISAEIIPASLGGTIERTIQRNLKWIIAFCLAYSQLNPSANDALDATNMRAQETLLKFRDYLSMGDSNVPTMIDAFSSKLPAENGTPTPTNTSHQDENTLTAIAHSLMTDVSDNATVELNNTTSIHTVSVRKTWGFFNKIFELDKESRLPKFDPLERWQMRSKDSDPFETFVFFDMYWRFDVLRPLYRGWQDYLFEFIHIFCSLFGIVPKCVVDVADKIGRDLSGEPHWLNLPLPLAVFCDLALGILCTAYCTLFAIVSFTFSVIGLFSRPLVTAILGTNDPELILEMSYPQNDLRDPSLKVDYRYMKHGKYTGFGGFHRDTELKNKPLNNKDIEALADRILAANPEARAQASQRAIIPKMGF